MLQLCLVCCCWMKRPLPFCRVVQTLLFSNPLSLNLECSLAHCSNAEAGPFLVPNQALSSAWRGPCTFSIFRNWFVSLPLLCFVLCPEFKKKNKLTNLAGLSVWVFYLHNKSATWLKSSQVMSVERYFKKTSSFQCSTLSRQIFIKRETVSAV